MIRKSILVIIFIITFYNMIDSYLISRNWSKSQGKIISKFESKDSDPSWYFIYEYDHNKMKIIDTTQMGGISENHYFIGENVKVAYKNKNSVLNNFSELYLPTLIGFLMMIIFYFFLIWIYEGFVSKH